MIRFFYRFRAGSAFEKHFVCVAVAGAAGTAGQVEAAGEKANLIMDNHYGRSWKDCIAENSWDPGDLELMTIIHATDVGVFVEYQHMAAARALAVCYRRVLEESPGVEEWLASLKEVLGDEGTVSVRPRMFHFAGQRANKKVWDGTASLELDPELGEIQVRGLPTEESAWMALCYWATVARGAAMVESSDRLHAMVKEAGLER